MRRFAALLAVLTLTLTACETSNIDSSAGVVVSGRVLRPDGSPAAGVPVGLERELTAGDVVTGLFILPVTLFTACLADPPPELCRGRNVRRTTTGPDGTYSFQVKGSDTQTSFGNARTLSVAAQLPAGAGEVDGPVVTASFRVQTEILALPDLRAWQPRVTVAPGRITWDPLTGAGDYQVGVEDARGQAVWSFESRAPAITFDPRVLEDTSGSLAVSDRTKATAPGTTVNVTLRSGRYAYRSTAGAPPSRGGPCTRGPAATTVASCPLTDGDLANALRSPTTPTTAVAPSSTAPPVPDSATVDLGQSRNVSLVVVRGCSCEVAGSPDGRTWTTLGQATGNTALVPPRATPARFVRVTGSLTDLHEVSVWEGAAPAPGAAAPVPAAAPAAAAPPPTAVAAPAPSIAVPEPARSRQGPALVALVALLLAAVGAAVTAVSRARLGSTRLQ